MVGNTLIALLSTALLFTPWPPQIEQWRELITASATRYGLDDDLIAAVIWQESAGDPAAERCEGWLGECSYGLMQVMSFDWRPAPDLLRRPDFSIDYGARILRDSIQQGGSARVGLALYNCGAEGVRADMCGSHGGLHYADRVLAQCRAWGGCRPATISRYFVQ